MSDPRQVSPDISFNGKNVKTVLSNYMKSLEFADIASGESDTIKLTLQNIDMKWLSSWYPKKGDKIKGSLIFTNWKSADSSTKLPLGTFILDEIGYKGGPLEAAFSGLAMPAASSFRTRSRTKTWKKITIRQIAKKICKRYKLKLTYDAKKIQLSSYEQSKKDDSSFLYEICEKYGLGMKAFAGKIIIFDKGRYERKKAIATLNRESFVDDDWEFTDTLTGTYTGASFAYKNSKKKKKTLKGYIGFRKKGAKGNRTLAITEQMSSLKDGKRKAAAQVNKANEGATVLSGTIWPNPKIIATATVTVKGLGKADGKYYVDKVTYSLSAKGIEQKVEMHKCQKRLTAR